MKKIAAIIVSFALIIFLGACTGYKPIFGSTNFDLEIATYSIKGDKKLGNKIYSQLYRSFRSGVNNAEVKSVNIIIDISKEKNATVKSAVGKVLEYKINLNTNIIFTDILTNKEILNYKANSSSSYKVRDQYFQTKKIENQTIQNLIDSTYRDLIIKMSEVMLTK